MSGVVLLSVDQAARQILASVVEELDLRAGDRFLIGASYAAVLVAAGFAVRCIATSRLARAMQSDADMKLLELTPEGAAAERATALENSDA